MTLPALRDAAEDAALRGAPLAVYVFVMHKLERHGYRPIRSEAVGKLLKMRRQTVAHAMRVLVERGYLELGPKRYRMQTFRLMETRKEDTGPLSAHHLTP